MNRSRIAFAVIALAAIVFLSLSPAAQALPLRGKPSVSESGGSWLDAAVAWVGRLLPGQGDSTRSTEKGNGGIIAYTGACIDPNGNRVPCPK